MLRESNEKVDNIKKKKDEEYRQENGKSKK